MQIIQSSFYQRNTVVVAKELIGKVLVRQIDDITLSGIINETEAYSSDDPACHAYNGKTKRNASLFGPVGHAYVYFTYGCHFCMNVVARDNSVTAGGVLIRSIIPLEGVESMQKLRGNVYQKNLANGPGKLTQALAINRDFDTVNLTKKGFLFIAESSNRLPYNIKATPRIGISKGQEKPWRFATSL